MLLVASNRVFQQLQSLVDVSASGCDLASTVHDLGEDALSPASRRVGFPSVESLHGFVDPPELEQRLDVVVGPRAIRRLEPPELQRAQVRLAKPLRAC